MTSEELEKCRAFLAFAEARIAGLEADMADMRRDTERGTENEVRQAARIAELEAARAEDNRNWSLDNERRLLAEARLAAVIALCDAADRENEDQSTDELDWLIGTDEVRRAAAGDTT